METKLRNEVKILNNNNVELNKTKAYDEGVLIKIYYDRADNKESEWNVWAWSIGFFANEFKFEIEDGQYVATIRIPKEQVHSINSLSYKIRKGDWIDQEDERKVDLRSILAGTVASRVNADGDYVTDTSNAVVGVKLNLIKYDRNTNKITITASQLVPDYENAFIITDNADDSNVEITGVVQNGTEYVLTIGKDLTSLNKVIGTYFITYQGERYVVSMPNVYNTAEFEAAYAYDGDDLGATWTDTQTTFKVWAPTAKAVSVQLYATGSDAEDGSQKLGTYPMSKSDKGTWTITIQENLNGVYYTYLTDVRGVVEESCDPYARTTGVNGKRAMVVNLESTNPDKWADDVSPNKGMAYTDAVIYELHVRDLSVNEESGIKDEWKGKFLGLTQRGTTNKNGIPTGLDHIRNLGVTHVHLLPSFDYGSIDETLTEEEKAANPSEQFNWGYDPVNYNVPEGSYSTNPYDGAVRIREMKKMVQALHENNINVVMDVVYNHVYDAGSFCFNEIVTNYFSRTYEDGTYSSDSCCGNDTASERVMVRKYIVDSVKYWADEYHIDGFRFDLVGLIDVKTINSIVDEVHKTHPDVIFYGEGWDMATAVDPADTLMAIQKNAVYTPGFAYFSDDFRDMIKGGNDEESFGFVQGESTFKDEDIDKVFIECFTANTPWVQNPTQVINYTSCHDNYTLMDKLNVVGKDFSVADRIKMNNLAAAMYMLAEGIPLIHAGEEMLRTKVDLEGTVIHNSYKSPDYVNSLKWGELNAKEYQQVREYYAGLIKFRKNHAILRLTTKDAVNQVLKGYKISDNFVLFDFKRNDCCKNEVAEEIVAIYNGNNVAKTVDVNNYVTGTGDWNICINGEKAGTDILGVVNGNEVIVEPYSALVLVKGADRKQ